METFLIKALQLILSLSILVIVHEFGHFIFARLYKIRVSLTHGLLSSNLSPKTVKQNTVSDGYRWEAT